MTPRKCLIICLAVLIRFPAVTVHAWPVPDTGQAQCYDDIGNIIPCPAEGQRYHGQDGNYSVNPMSYTKLDVNGNALTDSAPEWVMVRDNITGLTWEIKQDMDSITNYANPHDADNTYTWYDSNPATNGGDPGTPGDGTDTEDFIKALNDDHFGGYSDWRMPNRMELRSIVNYGRCNPAIDTTYFPNTPARSYQSSTTNAKYTSSAWQIHFKNGDATYYYKLDSGYVRAVRGGQ